MRDSLEVIQFLVPQHPQALKIKYDKGMTPLDLAKDTLAGRIPDPETIEWLEAVESGQIILPTLPSAPHRRGEGKANSPDPRPAVVDMDLAKLPTADFDDEAIAMDRCSVLSVLVGKNEIAAVSPSYIASIRTKEAIRNGFFGTVYKGIDTNLRRSFAIKAINTDVLWGGVRKEEETFLKEMKVIHSLHCIFSVPTFTRAPCI